MTYNEVKNNILKTFTDTDVSYDEEYISAYDLIEVIKKEINAVQYIIENKKEISLQFELPKTLMFTNSKTNIGAKMYGVSFLQDSFTFYFQKTNPLSIDKYPKVKYRGYFMLSKDNDSNELYISCYYGNLSKEFIKDFVGLNCELITKISNIFNEMNEKYGIKLEDLNKFLSSLKNITSSDSLYKIEFDKDKYKDKLAGLKLNDSESQQILKREWISRPSLYNFVLENEEVLLKKIAISINDLDPILQRMIKEHYNNKKNKQLIK